MTIGTSRIFRSTDEDAPQFSEVIGSMIPVLQAVLVDGYGDKESLNWELVYSDTNKIVVRPRFGTRQYIRFYDYSDEWVDVSTYSTMSTIDYGIDRMPDFGQYGYLPKRYSSGSADVPWMIIGDEIGFYFISKYAYPYKGTSSAAGAYWACFYIGDYTAWDINNRWNFCIFLQKENIARSNGLSPLTTNSSYQRSEAKRGSSFKRGVVSIQLLPFNTNTYFGDNNIIRSIDVFDVNGMYFHSPIHIIEVLSRGNIILGNMPGLFEPIGKMSSTTLTYNTVPYVEYINSNGVLNILLTANNSDSSTNSSTHKLIFKVGPGFRNVQ